MMKGAARMGVDTRKYPRMTIPGMEGTVSSEDDGWGTILNISNGGILLQFCGDSSPEIGSVVHVRMKLLGREIPIAIEGKVLRYQEGCIAIKFDKTFDFSTAGC